MIRTGGNPRQTRRDGRSYTAGVSELIDPRPVFTIVMGCDGVGKSAWKRQNYDLLPERYFDQDSVAGGIGDWNNPEARARTRVIIEAEIGEAMDRQLDFGVESTFSGKPGVALVERVAAAGYRVEGVYLGTGDPRINIARIEHRVLFHTGHRVAPERIPERWKYSLSNLRRSADRFDSLRILDNSTHDSLYLPQPTEQCELERGAVVSRAAGLVPWCEEWLQALAERQDSLRRLEAKRTRSEAM